MNNFFRKTKRVQYTLFPKVSISLYFKDYQLKLKTVGIVCAIIVSLTFYFVFSVYFLPDSFQSLKKPIPEPYLSKISFSESDIQYGSSFDIKITGTNLGDASDIQIISIGFPNLTSLDDRVKITSYDFRQSPFFIEIGDDVGINYGDTSESILAQYPSIEAYSRPWKSNDTYQISLNVTPDKPGKFVVFVKSVGLPHTSEKSHLPKDGFLDYQNEFVKVYNVFVNTP